MQNQKGQALLLILLTMAVVLVVVLSVLSRTITDITVTTKEEEALRAFSAAEAGIEKALIAGDSFSGTAGENASFVATVTDFGEGQTEYVYPEDLFSGESATFWFIDHDEDTGGLTCDTGNCFTRSQMAVCWGGSGSEIPAVEISIFYDTDPFNETYSDVQIARVTADKVLTREDTPNNFDSPDGVGSCTIGNRDFSYQKTVVFSDVGINNSSTLGALLFAKVRFFYNFNEAHGVGINVTGSGGIVSSQGKKIESIGTSGEANRKVEVYQTFGELPPIFDAVLFSPVGGVTKTN